MIKILLVEKNVILANYLREVFAKHERFELVGILKEGGEVIEFLKTNPVEVILMDHQQTNGFMITKWIKKDYPHINIVGFSTTDTEDYSRRLLELGASKSLCKYSTSQEELIRALILIDTYETV